MEDLLRRLGIVRDEVIVLHPLRSNVLSHQRIPSYFGRGREEPLSSSEDCLTPRYEGIDVELLPNILSDRPTLSRF